MGIDRSISRTGVEATEGAQGVPQPALLTYLGSHRGDFVWFKRIERQSRRATMNQGCHYNTDTPTHSPAVPAHREGWDTWGAATAGTQDIDAEFFRSTLLCRMYK